MRQHNVARFTQKDMNAEQLFEKTYEAVQNEAAAILASEGSFRVRGIDFASADDATKARYHEAEKRVRTKGRQAIENEVRKAQMATQVRALFDASPFCTVCNDPIEAFEKASVFTPIGGKDRLIHDNGECLLKVIEQSIGRYMGRGRGVVVGTSERDS
jgi:hypothetical protein